MNYKIDIVIPVLNEATEIPLLLDYLRSIPKIDECNIIVVDGGSTDETQTILKYYDQDFFITPASRAIQMNFGAAKGNNPILYFMHADSRPPKTFVDDVQKNIQSGSKIGCYRFQFDSEKIMLKINSWFTQFDKMWCRGGDQTLFVTRDLFNELDGYDEKFVVMEEYDFIKRARIKTTFNILPKSVLVSPRKYSTNSWLKVQIANLTAFRMYKKGVDPALIKKRYHELLNPY